MRCRLPNVKGRTKTRSSARFLRFCLAFGVWHLALLPGCVAPPPKHTSTYNNDPTLPLDVVLKKINANSGRISTLVAEGRFDAVFKTGDNKYEPLSGGIRILHSKPDQIRVAADAAIVGVNAFNLGSNGHTFWLSVYGKADTTWYGTPRGTTEVDQRLPIAPELLIDVLGVGTLSTDLLAQPVPTMRYNPDYAAYMLTWNQPMTDRWVILREVWYDRETFLPKYVWLYDRNGRVALRAKLGDYRPLTLDNGPMADGSSPPAVAHSYDLFLPEQNSKLSFKLDDVRDRSGGVPNKITYRFSLDTLNTAHRVDLDHETPQQ